jgi:D-arabinose 1-dehydrogenase-like Zn-dependent alcohol dehydrogenase
MIQLTEEQSQALRNGEPVRLLGPELGKEVVLLRGEDNIAPQTEHFPMSNINEAFARLESGKARYPIVQDADF